MNTTSIIALNLALNNRGIRNVEIIDVMDYGNGIDVCFKEADGKVWCLTENIMPEEWCELLISIVLDNTIILIREGGTVFDFLRLQRRT